MARIFQLLAILILVAGFVLAQDTDNSQGSSTDSTKDQNPSSQKSNSTSLENEKPKPHKKSKTMKPKHHNSRQSAAPIRNRTTKDDTDKGTMGDTGAPQNSDQQFPSQSPPSNPPPKR
jgi:hypothetical protein